MGYLEMPHVFFHHAAFSSSSKHVVCDIQGVDTEDGNFLLIDPVILRSEQPTVTDVLGAIVDKAGDAVQANNADASTSASRFDKLHPRCGQLCKGFDPHRRSAKQKAGVCGLTSNCGLGRTV